MPARIDTIAAVLGELRSATGLKTGILDAALRAHVLGAWPSQQAPADAVLIERAAAVARLCAVLGFQGSVRFPETGGVPDCWFFPDGEETVGLVIAATEDLSDPERRETAPVPAPRESGARVNGAQASIVRAFLSRSGNRARDVAHAGKWLVIYTQLGGFSDRLWDMLRTRFAGEDQIAPFARAFVVDIGPTARGFEL